MNRFQARDALATEIAKRTGTTPKPQADMKAITFGCFVRNRWLPLKEANWKEETARDKKWATPPVKLDTAIGGSVGDVANRNRSAARIDIGGPSPEVSTIGGGKDIFIVTKIDLDS